MNEKLMVFVVILLTSIVMVGFGVGSYVISIYRPQISQLQSNVSILTNDYNDLNITNYELQVDYDILNMAYSELEANYTLLTETIDVRLIDICTPAWLIETKSGSMQPTLNISNIVVVRKVPIPWKLHVGYTNGSIVAFWGDPIEKPGEIIVHRLVGMVIPLPVGSYIFTTHGDNNPFGTTERFSEDYLIGEVVAVISESSE